LINELIKVGEIKGKVIENSQTLNPIFPRETTAVHVYVCVKVNLFTIWGEITKKKCYQQAKSSGSHLGGIGGES
jgi:hypothetical protein